MRPFPRAALVGAVALAALAPAVRAQTVVRTVYAGTPAAKKPCPDTIHVSAAEPGQTARFVVRGAVDGVVMIAPGVRTVRRDGTGVELEATTPALIVVPQERAIQLVVAPLVPDIGIQVDRSGRDDRGRAIMLHAQGSVISLSRDGGTGLRVVADHVELRDAPVVAGRP